MATGLGALLGVLVLLLFGVRNAWKGTYRKQGLLMIVVAIILIANVLIWVL